MADFNWQTSANKAKQQNNIMIQYNNNNTRTESSIVCACKFIKTQLAMTQTADFSWICLPANTRLQSTDGANTDRKTVWVVDKYQTKFLESVAAK